MADVVLECSLLDSPFDPSGELARFSAEVRGDGAVASFTGLSRPATRGGEPVLGLTLEHHPRLTLRSMEEIGEAALARFPISGIQIIHRHGTVLAGEAIVFVAASSPHRRAALEAVDYAMDRLKTDAIFWKREETRGRSEWIEPTKGDYQDRSRWTTEGSHD